MAKQYYTPAIDDDKKVIPNVFYRDRRLPDGKIERRYRIVVSKDDIRYSLTEDKVKGTKHITDLRRAKTLAAKWRDEVMIMDDDAALTRNRRKFFWEMIDALIDKGIIAKRPSASRNGRGGLVYSSPNRGIEDKRIFQIVKYFGNMRLDRIDGKTVKEFADQKMADGNRPMSAVRYVFTLNNIFEEAIAANYLSVNPVARFREKNKRYFKKLKPEVSEDEAEIMEARTRELSEDMLACHRLACWEVWHGGASAAYLWMVMGFTGQRPSEIRRALRQDLRLSDRHVLIRPENQKSQYYKNKNIMRRVWLHDDILTSIDAYVSKERIDLGKDGVLFTLTPAAMLSAWKKIIVRAREIAGIMQVPPADQKRYTPYAIRHTVASAMVKSATAAELLSISLHLGHTVTELLRTYTHGDNGDVCHRVTATAKITTIGRKPLTVDAVKLLSDMAEKGAPQSAVETLGKRAFSGLGRKNGAKT